MSDDFRVKAATLGAMIADNDYAPAAVRDAYSSVRIICDGAEANPDTSLCALVYHTSVGDATRVRDLALEYAEHARRSSDKRTLIHGIRRAANALLRVGLHDDAHPLLQETLSISTKLKLPGQSFASYDLLVTSYLLCGRLNHADEALRYAHEIFEKSGSEAMRIMLRYSSALFAWITNDRHRASSLASERPSDVQHRLAATHYCATIGELALKLLLAPSEIDREELSRCRGLFIRGKGLGRQDINTSILCSAFLATGDAVTARRLEKTYRASRRELTSGLFSYTTPTAHP